MSKIGYFHYVKNKIDKFCHLACLQLENRNAVAFDCRAVVIILRQLKFKKSKSTHTFHYERNFFFEPMFVLESKWKEKNQIMKVYASGNVHFVNMTSLIFVVINRLYPKDQE